MDKPTSALQPPELQISTLTSSTFLQPQVALESNFELHLSVYHQYPSTLQDRNQGSVSVNGSQERSILLGFRIDRGQTALPSQSQYQALFELKDETDHAVLGWLRNALLISRGEKYTFIDQSLFWLTSCQNSLVLQHAHRQSRQSSLQLQNHELLHKSATKTEVIKKRVYRAAG